VTGPGPSGIRTTTIITVPPNAVQTGIDAVLKH
jgi:hypothetical protein